MKIKFSFLILCLWSTSLYAEEDPPNLMVLFGDSITVGYHAHFQEVYGAGRENFGRPARFLNELMELSRRRVTMINWGQGGTPTRNGSDRISSNLSQTRGSFSGSNRYVLILYGTNDFGWGLSPSDTRFYIDRMIDKARARGFTPVVANLLPRSDRDVSPYNSQIRSVASSKGATFVDQYSNYVAKGGLSLLESEISPISGQTIRLHPTREGYTTIAERWFNAYVVDEIQPISEPEPEPEPVLPMAAMMLLLLDD